MAQYSTGGFIVLPGGYGTFEEMMEMITWNQVCLEICYTVPRVGSSDCSDPGTACHSPATRHRPKQ